MPEAIRVEQTKGRYVARCTFAQKDLVKAAGFRWDPNYREWWTKDPEIAKRIADPEAAKKLIAQQEEIHQKQAESIEQSRATDADVQLPCPAGLAYLAYQKAGIAYGLSHPNVLIGDDMGLGKTIQAIGIINADESLKKILVVCPASLKINWKREMVKWLVRRYTIAIAEGQCRWDGFENLILVMNYDILDKNRERLHSTTWDAVIVDEAHMLKNPEAKRTQVIFGADAKRETKQTPAKQALPELPTRRRIALTGTPIPNRIKEGFGLFRWMDRLQFKSFYGFSSRYCGGGMTAFGWNSDSASNLDELQRKLRGSFMIRRLKADVLKELPAKRRSVIELPAGGASMAVAAEREAWELKEQHMAELRAAVELAKASEDPEDYKVCVENLKAAAGIAFTEMSKIRHDTAVSKLPQVIEHVRNCIEAGEKIVLFAHHRDVIDEITEEFGSQAVKLYGGMDSTEKQSAVDRFQRDPTCKLFVGGILAAGVGITLTASSHVIFAELDWVPGNVTQAEDRCHRIGQHDSVLVEHLVLEESIDARMARVLIEKQGNIEQALDRKSEEVIVPVADKEHAATEGITREKIAKEAASVTPKQIEAALKCLQILTAMDGDKARDLNGMGFSKADCYIGHELAKRWMLSPKQAVIAIKLANKYRRQLPDELVAAAKGEA